MRGSQRRGRGALLFLCCGGMAVACAPAADPQRSLTDVPVAGMMLVSPADYAAASAVATAGGSPLDIALGAAGPFEGTVQHMIQVNDGGEHPASTTITVLRDGLLDDSVRGERWTVALDRKPPSGWTIREVRRAWLCRRGAHTDRFGAGLCP